MSDGAVARQTLRDLVRRRYPHVMVAWLVLAAVGTPLARDFGLGAEARLGAEWLAGSAWLLLCAMALAIGSSVIPLNDTARLLVPRGLSATHLLTVRWLAAATASTAAVAVVALAYVAVAAIASLPSGMPVLTWAYLLWLEVLLCLTLALACRTLLPAVPAVALAIVVWWLGHLADETAALALSGQTSAPWLFAILPDLDRLNGHTALVGRYALPSGAVLRGTGVGIGWVAALLGATLWTQPSPLDQRACR